MYNKKIHTIKLSVTDFINSVIAKHLRSQETITFLYMLYSRMGWVGIITLILKSLRFVRELLSNSPQLPHIPHLLQYNITRCITSNKVKSSRGTIKCLFCFFLQMLQLLGRTKNKVLKMEPTCHSNGSGGAREGGPSY